MVTKKIKDYYRGKRTGGIPHLASREEECVSFDLPQRDRLGSLLGSRLRTEPPRVYRRHQLIDLPPNFRSSVIMDFVGQHRRGRDAKNEIHTRTDYQ
jgi:hypothetical protein